VKAKFVLGVGSGRCGSHSLARLFQEQSGTFVQHEMKPVLTWEPSPRFSPTTRFRRIRQACQTQGGVKLFGDVGIFYLNYIPVFINSYPTMRIVALKRDKKSTVVSYMRKMKSDPQWPFNHFSSKDSGHIWWKAYPNYDLPVTQALPRFYDEYYDRLAEYMRAYPNNVRLWPTAALNTKEGVKDILTFAGVTKPRVKVGLRVDVTGKKLKKRKR